MTILLTFSVALVVLEIEARWLQDVIISKEINSTNALICKELNENLDLSIILNLKLRLNGSFEKPYRNVKNNNFCNHLNVN